VRRYTMGEVCRILDVKPHILRYWEQEISLLSPSKDVTGRRTFTSADLQLLFRIKHLVQTRRYTVGGAELRIIDESSGARADAKARIRVVRHELLEVLCKVRKLRADNIG
jgi:DNA-binding transcriptional MerR regulator